MTDDVSERATAMVPGKNWAGNYEYRARRLWQPSSIEEAQELVAGTDRVRAIGSRHSFNDLGDSDGDLLDLTRLPTAVEIDASAGTAAVTGGMTYGAVAAELERQGWALHNLASLPHISVAGAIATATHGSGAANGNLASAVRALEYIDASGQLRLVSAGDDDFHGSVVSLGALGVVTRIWLAIEPSFEVWQRTWDDVPFGSVLADLPAIMASGYSVSLFTDWAGDHVQQLWVKSRSGDVELPDDAFGGTRAGGKRHPIRGALAEAATEQLGVPGRWLDRLPHFKMEFTPSAGDEIQSEYIVPAEVAPDAIRVLRTLGSSIAPVVQVSEIRAIATDDLWLSSSYGTDAIAFHFTWHPDAGRVNALLPRIEAALEPFAARPHWGKVSTVGPERLRELYARYDDFVSLVRRVDPAGTFRNGALRRWFPDLEA